MISGRRRPAPIIILVLSALATTPLHAQTPEREIPKNLLVLPRDTPRRQVVAVMRTFTAALGVRCTYCHVEGATDAEMDFASDAKDAKKVARAMMQMTTAVNGDWIARLPAPTSGARGQVTCLTCHRGTEKPPQALTAILAETTETGGAAAAIAKYQALRQTELESGRYDFRAISFQRAATRLADGGKTAQAIALAQQARALFPDSSPYQAFVGQLCAEHQDIVCAEAALRRALELDPNNAAAKRALDILKQ